MTMQTAAAGISERREGTVGRAQRFGDFLSALCMQLSGIALAVIVTICTVNVIARYVFAHAFSWAEEAMVYCMIFIIFVASAAVTWKGSHLCLDLLLRKCPAFFQKAIVVGSTLASVALLLLLAHFSYDVVARLYRYGQRTEALEIPMWIPQGFVPAGLVLIALMMVLRLWTHGPLPHETDLSSEDFHL